MGSRWQRVGGIEPPPDMDRIAADVITRHAATLEQAALSDRMRTIAANLAVGGALCAAFDLGRAWMDDWEPPDHPDRWRPGCGRAWGGGA